jgi:polysaccharide pyruvyl transferase WcaK-like protein
VRIFRIIIYGAYGGGNVGDEATLDVLIERLRRAMPEVELSVFSFDPGETERLHGVQACRPSLKALVKTDTLIIEDLDSLAKFLAGFLTRMLRKRVIYYAVGVPKLSFGMKLMIPLAMNGTMVYVRDLYSKKMLERYHLKHGILVIPDPALELKPLEKSKCNQLLEKEGIDVNRFLVGLSLRYSRNTQLNERVKQIMVCIVDWLVEERDAEIVFIPMCKHKLERTEKDNMFGEELRLMVNRRERFRILDNLNSPREVKGIFGLMDVCIGMRLHSAVFAYSMGVPYIGLITDCCGYDEKITAFMRRFCNQSPIDVNHVDTQFLKQKIVEIINPHC